MKGLGFGFWSLFRILWGFGFRLEAYGSSLMRLRLSGVILSLWPRFGKPIWSGGRADIKP